jgi:hypothetical protein
MEGYIIGTLSTLLSVSVGYALGKPWFDRWQARKHAAKMPVKPAPRLPVPMPGMGIAPNTGPIPVPTQP